MGYGLWGPTDAMFQFHHLCSWFFLLFLPSFPLFFLSFLFCFETVSLRCPAWIGVPGSGPFHLSLSSSWDPRYTPPGQLVSLTLSKDYFHLVCYGFFGSLKTGNVNKPTSVHRSMNIYLYQRNFLLKNPRTKTLFAYEIYMLQIERMVSSTDSCAWTPRPWDIFSFLIGDTMNQFP